MPRLDQEEGQEAEQKRQNRSSARTTRRRRRDRRRTDQRRKQAAEGDKDQAPDQHREQERDQHRTQEQDPERDTPGADPERQARSRPQTTKRRRHDQRGGRGVRALFLSAAAAGESCGDVWVPLSIMSTGALWRNLWQMYMRAQVQ